jgi:MFS family permease
VNCYCLPRLLQIMFGSWFFDQFLKLSNRWETHGPKGRGMWFVSSLHIFLFMTCLVALRGLGMGWSWQACPNKRNSIRGYQHLWQLPISRSLQSIGGTIWRALGGWRPGVQGPGQIGLTVSGTICGPQISGFDCTISGDICDNWFQGGVFNPSTSVLGMKTFRNYNYTWVA